MQVEYATAEGPPITQPLTVEALSRRTMRVDDLDGLSAATFSTTVTSMNGTRLGVERAMSWDASGYGSHTERATAGPAAAVHFAEGAQGFFNTYFLLQNPTTGPNTAHVTYLLEGGGAVTRDYPLPEGGRLTVDAGDVPELAARAFSTTVQFDQPGVAERAMYFGDQPFLAGGSTVAGSARPETTWYLAEGATGAFFSTYLLAMNPTTEPVEATFTYLGETGGVVATVSHTIPPQGRVTVDPADDAPELAANTFATVVTSEQGIVVERSMYWPKSQWVESHSSAGEPSLDYRWTLAEGRVGGASAMQTFILLANPSEQPALVTLQFLHDPADHGGQVQGRC